MNAAGIFEYLPRCLAFYIFTPLTNDTAVRSCGCCAAAVK